MMSMDDNLELACREANHTRYQTGQIAGHYESFFQRANHPTRPLAFWIRYTLFSPDHHPENALGELWAVFFDGETNHHVAIKREIPLAQCLFKTDAFGVQIGDARLGPGQMQGEASLGGHHITWDLAFTSESQPLFLLPLRLYKTRLPQAKSLVSLPMAAFNGSLIVDGQQIEITHWVGSHLRSQLGSDTH